MKKILPILIIIFLSLLLVGGAFWFLRGLSRPPLQEEEEEQVLRELSEGEKPTITLSHIGSCEYELDIKSVISGIASLEYEVTYTTEGGVLQGVPGEVKGPGSSITRQLLFGTESSGHRRCDKGVTGGNITIRYRNESGQLIAKVEQEFNLE